jgi:hypothetical protein
MGVRRFPATPVERDPDPTGPEAGFINATPQNPQVKSPKHMEILDCAAKRINLYAAVAGARRHARGFTNNANWHNICLNFDRFYSLRVEEICTTIPAKCLVQAVWVPYGCAQARLPLRGSSNPHA